MVKERLNIFKMVYHRKIDNQIFFCSSQVFFSVGPKIYFSLEIKPVCEITEVYRRRTYKSSWHRDYRGSGLCAIQIQGGSYSRQPRPKADHHGLPGNQLDQFLKSSSTFFCRSSGCVPKERFGVWMAGFLNISSLSKAKWSWHRKFGDINFSLHWVLSVLLEYWRECISGESGE